MASPSSCPSHGVVTGLLNILTVLFWRTPVKHRFPSEINRLQSRSDHLHVQCELGKGEGPCHLLLSGAGLKGSPF